MCSQYMEGNSFLQLPVDFHSNRWSGFRDFMFAVLRKRSFWEIAFKVEHRYSISCAGSYIFYCNSLNFWKFGVRLSLKYVEKMYLAEYANILKTNFRKFLG